MNYCILLLRLLLRLLVFLEEDIKICLKIVTESDFYLLPNAWFLLNPPLRALQFPQNAPLPLLAKLLPGMECFPKKKEQAAAHKVE